MVGRTKSLKNPSKYDVQVITSICDCSNSVIEIEGRTRLPRGVTSSFLARATNERTSAIARAFETLLEEERAILVAASVRSLQSVQTSMLSDLSTAVGLWCFNEPRVTRSRIFHRLVSQSGNTWHSTVRSYRVGRTGVETREAQLDKPGSFCWWA